MRIIDVHILRQYVKVLVICFLSLTGLYVVVDAFGHLDELQMVAKKEGNWFGFLSEYYGARSLAFFDRTSALMALLAATFAATSMQRSNELASLMAAGIPKIRVVMPLIIGAVAVSLLAVANRELLIPSFRDKLMRNSQDWHGEAKKDLEPRFDNRTDIVIGGRQTIAAEGRIVRPAFRLPPEITGFGTQLVATDAYFHETDEGCPRGYRLEGVEEPENLNEVPSLHVDGVPVILTSCDTAWLQPSECFVVSDISFDQLAAGNAWRQFSSTSELISGLHNPSLDFAPDVRVTVHARVVQPFLDVTLLFLGLPLVLSRERRNVFVAAGLCVLIVAVFFVVVIACHALGKGCLMDPSLAAWCPLLVFAPAARLTSQAFWH